MTCSTHHASLVTHTPARLSSFLGRESETRTPQLIPGFAQLLWKRTMYVSVDLGRVSRVTNFDSVMGRLERLPQGDPEAVQILDDEFTHFVFGRVDAFHDLDLWCHGTETLLQVIDMDIEIDVPSRRGSWAAAGGKHDITLAKRQ